MSTKKQVFPVRHVVALAQRLFVENNETVVRLGDSITKEVLKKFLADGVEPTEQELTQADQLIDEIKQRMMLNEIKGTKIRSDFVNNVFGYAVNESVPAYAVSFLAWVPKVVKDLQDRETKNLDMQIMAMNSEYFGTAGDRIQFNVNIVESRFVVHIGKFSVVAKTDQGNFVTFWFGSDLSKSTGPVAVKGRIKGHRVNSFIGNAKTTLLNFVKVIE